MPPSHPRSSSPATATPPPPAPSPSPSPAPSPEAVTPLIRGIAVLRRLTDAGGSAGLGELERATGLARSTVDRIVSTLARMGYVRQDGRDVVLAPRLMELGNAYLDALRLPALLSAHADALADELDESVSLAVADGDGIRFIHQATRRRALSLSFRIGDLLPAERTAPGPLLAVEWAPADWERWHERRAADPDDRGFPAVPPRRHPLSPGDFEAAVKEAEAHGWALDDQLIEPGLIALSAPVRAADGRAACVASVVSHTSRHSADSLRETLLPRLRTTVAAMERELSAARTPAAPPAPSGLAGWTGASKQELGREFVESLARGLTVVTAFGAGRDELTLTAVAEATGLARATARRALITLEHLGCVTAHGRTFRLTPRVLALGFPCLSRTTLTRVAHPHLVALSRRVGDATALAVPAGEDVQYTAWVTTGRIMDVDIAVGARLPAYATSAGRVLLAALPPGERSALLGRSSRDALTARTVTGTADLAAVLDRAGADGFSLVDGELEEGLRSIAVPVRDRTGAPVAAVNVTLHSSRRTPEQCRGEVLPELRDTAAAIEADLHVAERFTRVPAL
ncbi:IclR family transcriptional regulator C-terminal domain-containing protein [Streptomyces sp. NPDC088387]|uniref:IclR family transcriptional regulator domain-containing protein n=1 Tax=Streptomyces sp. NPDC088387 TaxID=3365859 RepID=UPI003826A45F